jgi:hypothetical protein
MGRTAAVLDNSYSSSGSSEKRRRPLGIALAVHTMLEMAARESGGSYHAFWTQPPAGEAITVTARGQTNLVLPLLEALDWGAETVVIVSDGFENDPPLGTSEILRVFRTRLDPNKRTTILHLNPVFSPDELVPHALSSQVPTVGLRDAEDLPTAVGFARFADGAASLGELEAYLAARRERFLEQAKVNL